MRTKLVFLFAVIFGIATAALAYFYLMSAKNDLENANLSSIVVAAQAIPKDTVLTDSMLQVKKIPTEYKHPEEMENIGDIVGKTALIPFVAGQSILSSQILAPGDISEGISYIIPKGKRAFTIAVNPVSGIAGLIKPGDRVDILVYLTEMIILPIQDVEVLAVGSNIDKNSKPPIDAGTITLALMYSEAKPLFMSDMNGTLRLMLRPPGDHLKGYYGPYKITDLINGNNGGNIVGEDKSTSSQ